MGEPHKHEWRLYSKNQVRLIRCCARCGALRTEWLVGKKSVTDGNNSKRWACLDCSWRGLFLDTESGCRCPDCGSCEVVEDRDAD